MKYGCFGLLLALTACASTGAEPTIVPKAKIKLAFSSILGFSSVPKERDGVTQDQTGAIMFICAGSDKHEDQEVLIRMCSTCYRSNYFYWQHDEERFACFACGRPFPASKIKCGDCGSPPRVIRTRPQHAE